MDGRPTALFSFRYLPLIIIMIVVCVRIVQFQEQQRAVRASLDTALDASTTVDKEHKVSCCGGGHASGEQCSAGVKEEGGDGCCSAGGGGGDMEEEEDLINNRYVTMDQVGGDDDEGGGGMCGTGDAEGDLEDLASGAGLERSTDAAADAAPREMVTKLQRLALTKEGYRLIGSHSAVKLCRWTKNQMRGRGGCYKHSFYGITSYQVCSHLKSRRSTTERPKCSNGESVCLSVCL